MSPVYLEGFPRGHEMARAVLRTELGSSVVLMGRVVGPNVSSGGAEKLYHSSYIPAHATMASLCVCFLPSKEQEERGSQSQGLTVLPSLLGKGYNYTQLPLWLFLCLSAYLLLCDPPPGKKKTHTHTTKFAVTANEGRA